MAPDMADQPQSRAVQEVQMVGRASMEFSASPTDISVAPHQKVSVSNSFDRDVSKSASLTVPPRVGIVVEDVSVHVKKKVTILKNVSCVAVPGQLTCLMGPSGSGKTTLLNVIASRVPKRRVTGRVLFNQTLTSPSIVKCCCSYVMAADHLFPYLTVSETLSFNCLVRRPQLAASQRQEVINRLIGQLELTDVKDSYVGGEWRKGLSTGQIKRLSIAIELLSDQPVVLLDEPTTGLDSKLALQLIRILRKVALEGKTVLVTLHQPSLTAFSLFDSLVLISKGYVLYAGEARRALDYFGRLGHICPPTFNPADFLIELVTDEQAAGVGNQGGGDDRSSSSASSHSYTSSSSSSILSLKDEDEKKIKSEGSEISLMAGRRKFCGKRLCEYGPFYSTAEQINAMGLVFADSPEAAALKVSQAEILQYPESEVEGVIRSKAERGQVGWRAQFSMIWKRTTLNSVRNPMVVLIIVLVNIVQALVLGAIFWQLDSDMTTIKSASISDLEIWNNEFVQYLAYGLDFNGFDPLKDMITNGVDNHNRSVLFDILTSQDILNYVHETVMCVHREAHLDNGDYPQNNWMQTTSSSLSGPSSSGSPFATVSMPIDQAITDLVTIIQIIDHYLLKTDYPPDDATNPLSFWLTAFSSYGPFVDPLLYCVDLATWETNYPTVGPPANLPNPLEPHNDDSPYYPGNGRSDLPASSALGVNQRIAAAVGKLRSLSAAATANEIESPEAISLALNAASHNKRRGKGLGGTAGPKRKLGSGLSGLIEDLIDMIMSSPNSPFYKLMQASSYYTDRLNECDYSLCQTIQDGVSSVGDYVHDTMTTLMTVINFAGLIFFLVACIGFASYDVLLQMPKERPIFNKEHASGLYHSTSYFLAKNIADFPFQVLPCVIWATIMYLMVGLALSPTQYFLYMAIAILTSFAAYGFGYLISAISPRMEVAIILAPLILVVMLCLSGFFIRDVQMPGWIGWFKYFSIYRWAYFATCLNQFPVDGSFGTLPNVILLAVCGITEVRMWFNLMILIVLAVGFRLVSFIALIGMNTRIGLEA